MEKIPNASDLVKETEYDATVSDNKTIYSITSDYNKSMGQILNKYIKEKE